ncbi:hypothetical protein [Gracilimonas sp. BCB1]|uniref:hypothetical protein n=1 Tax=Gracilimonas sp. BCB1 TaxID=3152362 RepID=UPI003F861983
MKFLLLLLAVLLNSGINQILAATPHSPPEAEIKQTKSIEFENTWLFGHAALSFFPHIGRTQC